MDILVSDEEMAELDRDIRPLWQEGGMSCPADGCDVFLQCMTKCRKHWSEIHTEIVFGYQCILCRFATMRRNQIIRHMGRVHPTSRPGPGAEDLFKRIQGKALCQFLKSRTVGGSLEIKRPSGGGHLLRGSRSLW